MKIRIDGNLEVIIGEYRQNTENICGYEFFNDKIFDYERIITTHEASTVTIEMSAALDWPAWN
jgi:hypothetical protein